MSVFKPDEIIESHKVAKRVSENMIKTTIYINSWKFFQDEDEEERYPLDGTSMFQFEPEKEEKDW